MAAPIRRRCGDHRQDGHAERRVARGHRRHAGRIRLSRRRRAVDAAGAIRTLCESDALARLLLADRRRAPATGRDARVGAVGDGRDRGPTRASVSGERGARRSPGADARGDRGRREAAADDLARRGVLRAADRMCERREPAADARGITSERACDPGGARGRARANRAADVDRECAARRRRRSRGSPARGMGRRSAAHAGAVERPARDARQPGRSSASVRDRCVAPDGTRLRHGARFSGCERGPAMR